ncbi:uncharacterized protein B0I36DRAFT_366667 [Microdochium trichocladiopsis]|uniref:Cyanovirin-N domain-containing protein n=1 Tax=Microdochium trichocladiopsis TaxID=1682393 RepID=A0A9P8XXS0_9PEZI|nr:uncharacterized protein B0I36DRAFT_366667 [Microdochium trichocladiopsis]KAH7024752.1 hypothetical protein B0I36DRAFT_366667 [Microdochium trichocladiopsis]
MLVQLTTVVAFAAALASANPIAAGDANIQKRYLRDYCYGWSIGSGTILYAKCRADDGLIRDESIDLNRCLANDNGALVHSRDGNFQASCSLPYLRDGPIIGVNYCYARDGRSYPSVISADRFATVNNGRLSCQ